MSINLVNLGNYPNDGTGDDLRTAFVKTNFNISYLDEVKVEFAENLGIGAPVFSNKQDTTLRFRSILSPLFPGGTPDIKEKMSISYDSEDITLSVIAISNVIEDTDPELGGNLNLNNFNIEGLGNISIVGNITANFITANNRFFGNLTGDVLSSGLSTFANIDVNSGTIDNTIIGNTTPNLITGTTITAINGFFGNLTGDVLSSGLSTFANIDVNSGTIDNTIIGNTTPNLITGTTITAINGFFGNLTGDSFGLHTGNVLGNLTGDSFGLHTGNVLGNLTGDSFGLHTGNVIGNLTGDSFGLHTGNVLGNLTGDSFGLHTGNVLGNLTGQVSDISNHNLSDLNNVSSNTPSIGQTLIWNGSIWQPGSIVSGVSKIIAGANVSITPSSGIGEVTVNSTGGGGGGGNLDFGTFTNPSGFTLDLGSFV